MFVRRRTVVSMEHNRVTSSRILRKNVFRLRYDNPKTSTFEIGRDSKFFDVVRCSSGSKRPAVPNAFLSSTITGV